MVIYVPLFESFYYLNLKMVGALISLEVHQRYGYFWIQGIKLHHIGGCHFLFGSDTLIGAPLMGWREGQEERGFAAAAPGGSSSNQSASTSLQNGGGAKGEWWGITGKAWCCGGKGEECSCAGFAPLSLFPDRSIVVRRKTIPPQAGNLFSTDPPHLY